MPLAAALAWKQGIPVLSAFALKLKEIRVPLLHFALHLPLDGALEAPYPLALMLCAVSIAILHAHAERLRSPTCSLAGKPARMHLS